MKKFEGREVNFNNEALDQMYQDLMTCVQDAAGRGLSLHEVEKEVSLKISELQKKVTAELNK